jgi:integrase
MAVIQKRDGARGTAWRVLIRVAGHPAVSRTFGTYREAQKFATQMEGKVRGGQRVTGDDRELFGTVLDNFLSGTTSGRTKTNQIELIKAHLGKMRLRNLSSASPWLRFAENRMQQGTGPKKQGAGPTTIGMDLIFCASALKHHSMVNDVSVDAQLRALRSARHQLAKKGLVSKSKQRDRRPSETEIDALLGHWKTQNKMLPMEDLFVFAIASGMRLGEITRLRWSDVDAKHRAVFIRERKHPDPATKAANHQLVALTNVTGYDAYEVLDRQPRKGERIFPYNGQSVGANFQRSCDTLKIDDLRWHDLRHEFASRCVARGVDVAVISAMTGHRSLSSLKRYMNPSAADVHSVVTTALRALASAQP